VVKENIDITRKCFICKECMSLETNIENVVYCKKNDKGSYYHFNCLVENKLNKRGNKLSKEEIENKIKQIQNEKDNIDHIKNCLLKNRFYKWLQNSYGVVSIPTYFFTKIDNVLIGEYKELSVPIPLEDLFDMWQRKKKELDGIYSSNIKKGNSMDSMARLSYDLAVIINKYDSYLKWKAQQKAMAGEIQKELEETKIDFNKVNQTVAKQQTDTASIGDILDEVF
jgi:hypothetical protein